MNRLKPYSDDVIETPPLYTFGFRDPRIPGEPELVLRRAHIRLTSTPRGNYVYLVFSEKKRILSIYLGARKKKKNKGQKL